MPKRRPTNPTPQSAGSFLSFFCWFTLEWMPQTVTLPLPVQAVLTSKLLAFCNTVINQKQHWTLQGHFEDIVWILFKASSDKVDYISNRHMSHFLIAYSTYFFEAVLYVIHSTISILFPALMSLAYGWMDDMSMFVCPCQVKAAWGKHLGNAGRSRWMWPESRGSLKSGCRPPSSALNPAAFQINT